MKIIEELETTSNNRVYNRARKHYLENENKINCAYCSYHKGENSHKSQYSRTWKRHRKFQYKT